MKKHWFSPLGWVWRPRTWQGFAVTGAAAVLCVQAFLAVDRHSHSASDTLFNLFPFVAAVFLLFNWIASHASDPAAGDAAAGSDRSGS